MSITRGTVDYDYTMLNKTLAISIGLSIVVFLEYLGGTLLFMIISTRWVYQNEQAIPHLLYDTVCTSPRLKSSYFRMYFARDITATPRVS